MKRPPSWVTRSLERVLPAGARGRSIVGDLLEEWSRRPDGGRRTVWYVTEALRLAVRYGAGWAAASLRHAQPGSNGGIAELTEDVRQTLRRLLRSPLQLALIVLALGLGVAAPVTMFTIVAGITRDLDVLEPDRVVHIGAPAPDRAVPVEWLLPLSNGTDALESVGLFATASFDVAADDAPPERLQGSFVSDGLFRTLGVDAAVGRVLTTGDHAPGAEPVVVIAWDFWQGRLGGDPAVVGRQLRIDATARTVVGVMPKGFHFRYAARAWVPLPIGDPARTPAVEAVGRLRRGATLEVVQSHLSGLTVGVVAESSGDDGTRRALLAQPLRYRMIARDVRLMAGAMVVLVSFVLLIACADVANLLVARALGRSRDTAVRVALGAGRWRIVRLHLAEGFVVSTLGGLLGLALAAGGVALFERKTASFLTYWMVFRLDLPVLTFSALLVLLAASVTGLLPALQSGRVDVLPAIQMGGRGGSGYRIGGFARWLVIGEIALSTALLAVAGLMGRGVFQNLRTDGSFDSRAVLTARYELREDAYDGERVVAFHRDALARVTGLPRVSAAALSSYLPGVNTGAARVPVEVDGEVYARPQDRPSVHVLNVSPGFFAAVESELLGGRDLTWQDGRDDPPAALVNEAFARRWLGGREPLGALVRLAGSESDAPWARVVGIVGGTGLSVDEDGDASGVFFPLTARTLRSPSLLVRAEEGTDPLALAPDLANTFFELDPKLPLFETGALRDQIATSRLAEAIFAILFAVFGLAGVVLAAVGLYGLLSFTVGQRTRELGVRIALGAPRWRVLWLALGSGSMQLAAGLAAGCALAAGAAPVLGEALRGTDPRDPLVYGSVVAVLALAGLLAGAAPAWRAIRVDVMTSLRTD